MPLPPPVVRFPLPCPAFGLLTTQTPSARRFVARRDQNQAPPQAAVRSSAAHAASPQPQAHAPAQPDVVTPSQQFKPTPRFSIAPSRPKFSSTPRPAHPGGLSQPTRTEDIADAEIPSVSRRPRPRLRKVESIHDDSQEGSKEHTGQDEEMIYDAVAEEDAFLVEKLDEHPTRGQKEQSASPSDGGFAEPTAAEEQPPKRRRLTPRPGLIPEPSISTGTTDPVKMDAGSPVLGSPPQSSRVPRFRVPGHSPAFPPTGMMEPASAQLVGSRHRNPFLLHPTRPGAIGLASDANATPLPEHFSPHRRSQKFLPGGMADVVRTWVLSVGQSGSLAGTASTQTGQRTDRTPRTNQPSKFHVTECVEERPGDRLTLVSGRTDARSLVEGEESSSARAILVGPAKRNSRTPNVGDDITVLPPNWEIEVGQHGEKWLVGVDWRVT
ncbi:hypothetical protein BK809_0001072 [Diplodia seriata]|uniref:Uncharacterized protein n=1 Tax=Diplodia seriata TaxID=420778 RepID=A0A1S8B6R5_9PEZI|nr:hypothetical protein BK809_0001072 [Diplodia seriata]